MNIQVVNAIALALLHFTNSDTDQSVPQIVDFIIKLNNVVDNKLVFISTMYFYKIIHISESNVHPIQFDPKVLWLGCLLTACKHHSTRNHLLEDWEVISGISVRAICAITQQLYAMLGHGIIVQEVEIDEFTKVFTKMSLEVVSKSLDRIK